MGAACGSACVCAGDPSELLVPQPGLRQPSTEDGEAAAVPPRVSPEKPLALPGSGAAGAGASQSPRSPGSSLDETPVFFTGPMAGSLNSIVEHLWPRISAYASEAIIKEVQPKVLAALPSALQGLSFEQEKCHLGQHPLEFRRVHIEKESQQIAAGEMESLVFQARTEWFADCSVYLSFKGAGLGIKGLTVKGVLLVKIVGLMDRPPFFQGVQVFFNNQPELDLEFQGTGQGILNSGLVRNKVLGVLAGLVSDLMVVPNRLGYTIVPEADIFNIKSPPARGILTLTVLSAEGLLAMDRNWLGRKSSDPYVQIRCGAYKFRSPTKYKTLAPKFSYSVALPVWDMAHQRVEMDLFDEDVMSHDDFLGRLSLPVDVMIRWGCKRRVTLKLLDENRDKGQNGTVCISAEWRPLQLDALGADSDGQGLVFAGVYSASNLPNMGEGAQYWVSVRCTELLPGFFQGPQETKRCVETRDPIAAPGQASTDVLAIKSKLAVLQSYGMSDADMAGVLGIDEEKLRASLLQSNTRAAEDLAGLDRCEVQWDHGFEFPVGRVRDSVVSFGLMGQAAAGRPTLLGTYQCSVSELTACPDGASSRTVQVPGTSACLKLKLELRYLGGAAAARPAAAVGGA